MQLPLRISMPPSNVGILCPPVFDDVCGSIRINAILDGFLGCLESFVAHNAANHILGNGVFAEIEV